MAPQTLYFASTPPNPAFVGNSYNLSVWTNGNSGSPIVKTSKTTSICTISGGGSQIKTVGPGFCIVAANQAGGNGYLAAPEATQGFAVWIYQAITFTSSPPHNARVGGTYLVTAKGGASGNPVIFQILYPYVGCSINGSTVSFLAAGTCSIGANQGGTVNGYYPAAQVNQSFNIR